MGLGDPGEWLNGDRALACRFDREGGETAECQNEQGKTRKQSGCNDSFDHGRHRIRALLPDAFRRKSDLEMPEKPMEALFMRIALLLVSLVGAAALHAAEPLIVPDFVKYFDELEEAQKEAVKANKGITFLLMEPGST